ncbi:MAG: YbaB/EbfC family nucleoid-associated protein [Pirellulaceae bacterium]
MFKGLGNIAGMLGQMKDMGSKMEALNQRLSEERVVGVAGGEMVKVEANGLGQIIKVTIDPTLQQEGDWEMAQDLLPAAINDAVAKAKKLHVEGMQDVTGGMNLPGLDKALEQFGINQ